MQMAIMTIVNNMSFHCPLCGFVNPERDNIYGTICSNCESFIPPENKPKLVLELEKKHSYTQNVIREYLKKKMLGETNGNKVEPKS